jgi:hypothetical protein
MERSYRRGGHPYVIKLLHQIKWAIMHTCVHEEEPICGPACVLHVTDEVDEIHEKICELGEEIGTFLHHGHTGLYVEIHDTIDDMAHILDELHEDLRKHHSDHAAVKSMLHKACSTIKKEYTELVHDMQKLGAISHHMVHLLELR